MIRLLNQRLLSICHIDMPLSEFDSCSKDDFIRSILTRRQTTEIAHLVVCIIVDNNTEDLVLVGRVAQHLLQLRMMKPLLVLLRYVRQVCTEIETLPNIATYYGRLFEWVFDNIDTQNEGLTSEMVDLIYFLIGCPVEGGSSFTRAIAILNNYDVEEYKNMVAIAAHATAVIINNIINNF